MLQNIQHSFCCVPMLLTQPELKLETKHMRFIAIRAQHKSDKNKTQHNIEYISQNHVPVQQPKIVTLLFSLNVNCEYTLKLCVVNTRYAVKIKITFCSISLPFNKQVFIPNSYMIG